MSAEGAGRCDYEATSVSSSIMVKGRSAQRLEERKCHSDDTLTFKKVKEYLGNWMVSFTLTPGKVVEQLILENSSRHMKEKKIIVDSPRVCHS